MGDMGLTPNYYTAYKQQSQDTNTELSDPRTLELYFSDCCIQITPSVMVASAVVKVIRF